MSRKKKIIIEYRHYSLPINFPVLLLSGDRWKISDIKSEHLHFHDCLEIGICHSHSGFMEIEGNSVPFKAGDVTCVPRFLPHTTYSSQGSASLWSYIFFSPNELFKNLFRSPDNSFERPMPNMKISNYILSKEKYPKVYNLVSIIVDELNQRNPFFRESARGLLLSLYIELLRIYSKNEKLAYQMAYQSQEGTFVISEVLEYIYKNYMSSITIDFLADLCHLSTTHFRRIFHEIMGASPLEFINSTRIEEACKLLRSTEDSILSISEQVGFHSISSFNRCFAKLIGESPRAWCTRMLQSEYQSAKASILEFTGWL
ncbi:AraC family transcriptional regulator [Clostridium lacusfryxellense]|uniref:AraC family transcriptional regulator n=1 Tax=Clostridium lacusfryxellense TaxID=205328 RepID=UPI001C0D9A1C|nr:AraC family transcriptional regulator [Clostridium lacusfryxellense]MBU3114313.1 AraC family transcriptional regulator [Clostridium lacusfryxellense]